MYLSGWVRFIIEPYFETVGWPGRPESLHLYDSAWYLWTWGWRPLSLDQTHRLPEQCWVYYVCNDFRNWLVDGLLYSWDWVCLLVYFSFVANVCGWHIHMSYFWGHWCPCFGFLGFKARVGSALPLFCRDEYRSNVFRSHGTLFAIWEVMLRTLILASLYRGIRALSQKGFSVYK